MITWNTSWGSQGELGTHRGFVFEPHAVSSMGDLKLGHVVSFIYETKHISSSTDPRNTPSPRFGFIVHPNFHGKCHALTLKNIDRRTLVKEIMPHIKKGMTDPNDFYQNVYKNSALYDSDAYRTYLVSNMKGVTQFKYSVPDEGSDAQRMEEFLKDHPIDYTNQDRAVIYNLFRNGYGMDKVEEYYRTIVLKRGHVKA